MSLRFSTYLFLLGLSLLCLTAIAQKNLSEPEMVWVEGGRFEMGSATGIANERPAHIVQLRSYSIARYEVTQLLWVQVMGSNPSFFKNGEDYPVEEVSPAEIDTFLAKLNSLTGKKYRLPTEAEWEYAALGGKKSTGTRYAGSNTLDDVAWYMANSEKQKKAVKGKDPNQLGLYDMSGNVSEWCSDWYDYYYGFQIVNQSVVVPALQTNPKGPDSGTNKIVRGGSVESDLMWSYSPCHVKYRHSIIPTGIDGCWGNTGDPREPTCNFIKYTGFRLVISAQNQ